MDNIINIQKNMGNKSVIVCMTLRNQTVVGEFESLADTMSVDFGVERKALFDVIFDDIRPYEEGNVYKFELKYM
ncbi:hypothetical protein [Clostridium beijerinckii]|nr:hypothetical protein [Clostridium beijerinckii]MBC2420870.1 hypothetical protein [Clostridium beijerinckii]MBC2528587.1 hypothetical protein [Clostridium beijerinckii]MBC2531743.1 hypothetical protein [Clostridium beijerinckii]MBC2538245.1 hypothetical protein [Clostridium beijerinckii]MBC2549125.1 hypothetical protein [Clostridium beijerinckii]